MNHPNELTVKVVGYYGDQKEIPICGVDVTVTVTKVDKKGKKSNTYNTGPEGSFKIEIDKTVVSYKFEYDSLISDDSLIPKKIEISIDSNDIKEEVLLLVDHIRVHITPQISKERSLLPCEFGTVGSYLYLKTEISGPGSNPWWNYLKLSWDQSVLTIRENEIVQLTQPILTAGVVPFTMKVQRMAKPSHFMSIPSDIVAIEESAPRQIQNEVKTATAMRRTETSFTEDMALWAAIRNSSEALSFDKYFKFMNWIFCGGKSPYESGMDSNYLAQYEKMKANRFLPFTDSDAYRVFKAATETFVMVNCGAFSFDPEGDNAHFALRDLPLPSKDLKEVFNEDYLVGIDGNVRVLPYLAVIRQKLPDIPIKTKLLEDAIGPGESQKEIFDNCYGILQDKLENPCMLELIWSYWHEEGMLVQTMNAITRRFQNIRSSAKDPLANMEIDTVFRMGAPVPLSHLLWGHIQDEQHRLTLTRRNYEYDHQYGLRLEGKAVRNFRPADTRSKFLEAFHQLLRICTIFYKQDDDTTVKADAFPVLNALKEVHLILSEGAHNGWGNLPSTARIEMYMQKWILANPALREFLPSRTMVAYPEPWMDRVDAMKKLQGWTDTSVLHFSNLGTFGEQILLSIRFGHWSKQIEPVKAFNWARNFRPLIQGYNHAYGAATGLDLSADPTVNTRVDSTLPSVLLQKRLASQQASQLR